MFNVTSSLIQQLEGASYIYIILPKEPSNLFLRPLRKGSDVVYEWICVKSFDDNTYFNITIYDIEWDYCTSIEPAIVMTALYNSSLPVVVYFPASMTTSHIQINIPSTIRLQYTTGITSKITSRSPTRSLHYTSTSMYFVC